MKSFAILNTFLLLSCIHGGPKVTVCLVNSETQGCDCYNETTRESYSITLAQCDKYIALPPTDAQTLLQYCGSKK